MGIGVLEIPLLQVWSWVPRKLHEKIFKENEKRGKHKNLMSIPAQALRRGAVAASAGAGSGAAAPAALPEEQLRPRRTKKSESPKLWDLALY